MAKSDKENLVKEYRKFMREVGLVTDNNIYYYSPFMNKDEWFVSIWSANEIRVINDVYLADNEDIVCTTNSKTIHTLEEFKEKLTSAIERSKQLLVYLRKKTIDRDFVKDDDK